MRSNDSPICGKQACGDSDLLNHVSPHRRQLQVQLLDLYLCFPNI